MSALRESWIFRAALVAGIVLSLGALISSIVTIAGIDSVARLAHDQKVEQSLTEHLRTLKDLQTLRQNLLLAQLRTRIPASLFSATQKPQVSADEVVSWLKACQVEGLDVSKVEIRDLTAADFEDEDEHDKGDRLMWMDMERLRLFNKVAVFNHNDLRERYLAAEETKQSYELVGDTLQSKIRPTILLVNALALLFTFLALAGIFIVLARRFKSQIDDVIAGFVRWAEHDQSFRFADDKRGELRLIAQHFNAMADDVERNRQRTLYLEKLASWQIIARKIAHEIKNPLTPIQMMVAQLRRNYRGDDPAFTKLLDDAVTIITQEITTLTRMVENFSEFAKLPQPKLEMVDISEMLRLTVELERAAFSTQHEIIFHDRLKAAPPLQIAIDAHLIKQVVINLIKNAAEASGDVRKARIEVVLEALGRGDRRYVEITVIDDGPQGVAPENLGRIFEAYFTTKHTGPKPGMGLGLAICQKIILEHRGGDLRVKSRPGRTEFTIRLQCIDLSENQSK